MTLLRINKEALDFRKIAYFHVYKRSCESRKVFVQILLQPREAHPMAPRLDSCAGLTGRECS